MTLRILSIVSLAGLVSACGIAKDEHARLLGEARKAEKKACADQMAAAKAETDAERQKLDEAHGAQLAAKSTMIEGLEKEVETLGGSLEKVRTELGERATALASTRTELEARSDELRTQSEKLAATESELKQLQRLREEAEKEAAQFKALADQLKSMVDSGKLAVVMRDGRINLKLPDAVLFPSGSKRLKKDGKAALTEIAEVLKGVDREFLIAGHTDDVPLRRGGRIKDNWELSTQRALTVVRLLIDAGVPAERLAGAGYGQHDPIVANDSDENRQKNRRLEIILQPNLRALDSRS